MTATLQRTADGVLVRVRLTPKAGRERVVVDPRAGASPTLSWGLKASVTAPPEKGKANAALTALLARTWAVPKTSLCVVSGAHARDKTVKVSGDPDALFERLGAWIAAQGAET